MSSDNLPFGFQVKKVPSCGLRMVLGTEQKMKIFLESFILSLARQEMPGIGAEVEGELLTATINTEQIKIYRIRTRWGILIKWTSCM